MVKKWNVLGREKLGDYYIFEVWGQQLEHPHTREPVNTYQIVSNTWVNIIPLTPDQQVVMIRQYRFGSDEITLEIPGGLVEVGEDPQVAGIRELREETGYIPGKTIQIGKVRPNPAIHPNWCHTFLCEGCSLAGNQALDENEIIEVTLVPLERIPMLILDGKITHSLVIAAFHYLDLYRKYGPSLRSFA